VDRSKLWTDIVHGELNVPISGGSRGESALSMVVGMLMEHVDEISKRRGLVLLWQAKSCSCSRASKNSPTR
jgi:hypothetical protein